MMHNMNFQSDLCDRFQKEENMEPTYDELIAFHGHSCAGLAIGYRMSKAEKK